MLRLLKCCGLLLVLLASAVIAQDKPAASPKPTPEVQKLLDEAGVTMKKYEWKKAIQILEQARDIAQKAKDITGEARTLDNIGLTYEHSGQFQNAIDYQ